MIAEHWVLLVVVAVIAIAAATAVMLNIRRQRTASKEFNRLVREMLGLPPDINDPGEP